jgi:hypothetical protein
MDRNLEPGVYVTCRPVENPEPDRRVTRDWRKQPVIPTGTRLVVVPSRFGDPPLERQLMIIEGDQYSSQHLTPHDPLYAPIRDALRLAPESVRNVLLAADRIHCQFATPTQLLQHLVDQGVLTYAQLRLALKEISDLEAEDGDI